MGGRENCCICGSEEGTGWCNVCQHFFCQRCRDRYFFRGIVAVKQWLMNQPPKHCNHKEA